MTDTMVPSYIVLNPDGTIGADFTGHVHATGLDLDEAGGGGPTTAEKVAWLDSGHVERESLYGQFSFGAHRLVASAGGPVGPVATVIGSDNLSSFMRLAGNLTGSGRGYADGGLALCATNGLNSATKTIGHALGNAPQVAFAVALVNPNAIAQINAVTAADLTVRISHRDAGVNFATDTSFYWLAIG